MQIVTWEWLVPGLVFLGVAVLLIKAKGAATTILGLLLAVVGLYAVLTGLPFVLFEDRMAIVMLALLLVGVMTVGQPVHAVVKIVGLIVAVFAFIGLSSALTVLPDTSPIKVLLTALARSVEGIVRGTQ